MPGGRSADCLAPPRSRHRLDLLWRGTTVRSAPLYRSVRRLRAVRGRVARCELRSLVLNVRGLRGVAAGGSFRAVAVSRRAATVSSMADSGMGGALWSRVERTCGRVHAGTFAHSLLH